MLVPGAAAVTFRTPDMPPRSCTGTDAAQTSAHTILPSFLAIKQHEVGRESSRLQKTHV